MQLSELLNHRVSYQVLITFDLEGADTSKYQRIRDTLAEDLDLERVIHLSKDDGGKFKELPHNTFATLWAKDSTEQETRDYFRQIVLAAFKKNNLKGRYVILVAQNWAVSAGEF